MRSFFSIIFSMLVITSFGQLPGEKNPTDQVWKTLNGASFSTSIKKRQYLYFSSTVKKDTIELTIPKGKIKNAQITITIKSFDHKNIFQSTIPCYLFAFGAFDVESIPKEISTDEYNAIYNKKILSTSKLAIEQFTKSKIDSFFNHIIVNGIELENCLNLKTYDESESELFMTVMNDQKPQAIKMISDEGEGVINGEYLAYSLKKKAVVRIAWVNVNAPSGYLLK